MEDDVIIHPEDSKQNNFIESIIKIFEETLKKNEFSLIQKEELREKIIDILKKFNNLRVENKSLVINQVNEIINSYLAYPQILKIKKDNGTSKQEVNKDTSIQEGINNVLKILKEVLIQSETNINKDAGLKNKLNNIFNKFNSLTTEHQKAIILYIHPIIMYYLNQELYLKNRHKH